MSTVTHALTAADIMHSEVLTAKPTTTLHEACQSMLEHHVSGLPVVDIHRRCIGVVTSTDIVNFLDSRCESDPRRRHRFTKYFNKAEQRWDYTILEDDPPNELDEHEVSEVMTRPVIHVTPNASIKTVASKMKREHCHRILVLDEGKYLKGIISSFDFVTLVADGQHLSDDR